MWCCAISLLERPKHTKQELCVKMWTSNQLKMKRGPSWTACKKSRLRLRSRLRRRPDPSRHRRRSGYLASSRRPSGGADPAPRTTTRGEAGRYAAMRAETTAEPTVGREGRSGAVSTAAGAVGDSAARSGFKIDPSVDL
jgi:hypothetical protein